TEDEDRTIDTNLKGRLNVRRAIMPHMVARRRGHVVNIGAIAGYQTDPMGNVYNATKFGVRALTEGMNLDVAGTPLRVSAVDPGLVETEFSEVRFHGDKERAATVYQGLKPLSADDVADAIAYIVNLPEHVNILASSSCRPYSATCTSWTENNEGARGCRARRRSRGACRLRQRERTTAAPGFAPPRAAHDSRRAVAHRVRGRGAGEHGCVRPVEPGRLPVAGR